ncbi:MAG: hypothetical protein QGG54_01160 [Gammaproteobacteria bacterium]|jgi:hypothetical protein|nr:hypothetical protein [Gammaproteobacteria bacterium]|tara:strand:+ start:3759 stop:4283 length:525 start_codon:yes stop_codon:yes gene_type:complete
MPENVELPLPLEHPMQHSQHQLASPHVTFVEAKELLRLAKEEYKIAKSNAKVVTSWGRPAHRARYCQYCPYRVETPLQIDPVTGLFREACQQHQYLIDNLHVTNTKVRKFETMRSRIKSGELVPRHELEHTFASVFTPEEQAHLRELGYVHRTEVHAMAERLINDILNIFGEEK